MVYDVTRKTFPSADIILIKACTARVAKTKNKLDLMKVALSVCVILAVNTMTI